MRGPSFSLQDSRAREMRAHVKIASREKDEKWREREKWETTEKAQSFDFMHCSHNVWLWLSLPRQSVNVCQKSTGHCQHSTKSQFLSMSDKLQVCLEKICLITSLKKEQTQAVKPCWKGEMYLGYFQPDLGKVLSRVQHSTNICKHKHPHYFST